MMLVWGQGFKPHACHFGGFVVGRIIFPQAPGRKWNYFRSFLLKSLEPFPLHTT